MTRRRAVVLGLVFGILAGCVVLGLLFFLFGGRERTPAGGTDFVAATAVEAGEGPSPGLSVRYLPVTIYQRATTEELALAPAVARIVDFPSPVEKARQIVRLALEGVLGAEGVLAVPRGVHYREVFIDDRRTAWVDLDGASLGSVGGSEDEQLVMAVLARSLVEDLDEVDRVGLLIDGRPAASLRGHIDLSRTYTGREWPVAGSGEGDAGEAPPPAPEAETPAGETPGEG